MKELLLLLWQFSNLWLFIAAGWWQISIRLIHLFGILKMSALII